MNILRKIFRVCYSIWQDHKQKISWKRQYCRCIEEELVESSHQSIDDLQIKNILILCPHADDEWIGCSSLISSDRYQVDVLYYSLYGYNQSEENKAIRDQEIRKCSTDHHFSLLTSSDITQILKDLLVSNKYDAVFSPSPIDWHWEHRYVFDTLVEVYTNLKASTRIFCYFISVPHVDAEGIYLSYFGEKEQRMKWLFFDQNYASQKMPIMRYMLQERLNVSESKKYAAEIFQELSDQRLRKIYNYIHQDHVVGFLNSLSKEINNIYQIRKICKHLRDEG